MPQDSYAKYKVVTSLYIINRIFFVNIESYQIKKMV